MPKKSKENTGKGKVVKPTVQKPIGPASQMNTADVQQPGPSFVKPPTSRPQTVQSGYGPGSGNNSSLPNQPQYSSQTGGRGQSPKGKRLEVIPPQPITSMPQAISATRPRFHASSRRNSLRSEQSADTVISVKSKQPQQSGAAASEKVLLQSGKASNWALLLVRSGKWAEPGEYYAPPQKGQNSQTGEKYKSIYHNELGARLSQAVLEIGMAHKEKDNALFRSHTTFLGKLHNSTQKTRDENDAIVKEAQGIIDNHQLKRCDICEGAFRKVVP